MAYAYPNPASTRFIGDQPDPAGDAFVQQPLEDPLNVLNQPDSQAYEVNPKIQKLIKASRDLWLYETQIFEPVRRKIDATFEQYNNRYRDDESKDEGQSRKVMPQVFMTVERMAAAFSKFIEQKSGWFESEGIVPTMQVFLNLNRTYLDFWLTHDRVDFFSVYEELVKSGLLTGQMCVMVTVEQDGIPVMTPTLQDTDGADAASPEDDIYRFFDPFKASADLGTFSPSGLEEAPFMTNPNLPRLAFTVVPSSLVRLDSSGANRYKMWRTYMGIGEFLDTAVKRGWDMSACLRAVRKKGVYFDENDARRWREQNLNRSQESGNNIIELLHVEGSIHDPIDGEGPLTRKEYHIIANDVEMVLPPVPIPFWDGESVMVCAPFVKASGAVYGKTPIGEAADVFDERHETHNMLLDYITKVLNTPIQIDRDVLSAQSLREEVLLGPNVKIEIQGKGNPNAQAVKPVQWPDLPTGFWQYLQAAQTEQSEMTGMTQELMGSPRTRGRITGMEYQTRQSESSSLLGNIFGGLERRLLKKVLRISYLRLLQYTPDHVWKTWVMSMSKSLVPDNEKVDPAIKKAWMDALNTVAGWSKQERFKYLGSFFTWKIKMYSTMNERQMEIEKGTFLLNVLGKTPGALQAVKLHKIIERIVIAFGWDPEQVMDKSTLPLPRADLDLDARPDMALNTGQGGEPLQVPDLSGGAMQDLNSQMNSLPGGSTFPGGPTGPAPNMPKEPQ